MNLCNKVFDRIFLKLLANVYRWNVCPSAVPSRPRELVVVLRTAQS